MLPTRLRRLPATALPGGLVLYTAATPRSRLLGLAGLPDMPAHAALLLPRCRAVHTFGMRFPLDLLFVGAELVEGVRPRRVVGRRGASAVVEARAGEGARFAAALSGWRRPDP